MALEMSTQQQRLITDFHSSFLVAYIGERINPLMLAATISSLTILVKFQKLVKKIFEVEVQVNLEMTDSMGPGKLLRHMQSPSYTYDEYLICIVLGQSISSVVCKNLSYSGPSYPSSPVLIKTLPKTPLQIFCNPMLNS